MMEQKYFHQITDPEWEQMVASRATWGDIKDSYIEPPWCSAGDAVDPLGCWSLVSTRSIRKESDCSGCPEYNPFYKR